ncbi:MAG: phospho-sugar mutase [Oscillospiraceae bacterium]|nr:phospho-sugar mutase [Oscillospiraceae bacterium]
MTANELYTLWLENATGDILEELKAVEGNEQEILRRFGTVQAFGTAGIRSVMGAGASLLNEYTVRRVARGLAAYMMANDVEKSCAIGYDCRHNSQEFAKICAAALAAEGVKVYLYDRLAPTPMLSFAVRHLGCGAGMVISASHNTKEYNGLKCYGPDGCQMTEEPAALVSAEIEKTPMFLPEKESFDTLLQKGQIEYIGADVWEAYYARIQKESIRPNLVREMGLGVVYSPLCGAGGEPVAEILRRLGAKVYIPESQKMPSGDFATCPNPNPENDGAFAESFRLADTVEHDIILATDPDSDRIACAVKTEEGYQKLSGNEMGCLLLDYVLGAYQREGKMPTAPMAVMSIVSSPMAARIAEFYGCHMRITPTGFKYIGAAILELEGENRPEDFILGFEESCGYLKGTYCRDKDAVSTAMLIAEMAAYYKQQGKTLLQVMDDLYTAYGFMAATLQNIVFTTPEVKAQCQGKLSQLKTAPPTSVAGIPVLAVTDFTTGIRTLLEDGSTVQLDFPRENMIRLELAEGGRIIVRPSGTEPKMKVYYTAVSGESKAQAYEKAALLQEGMTAFLNEA